MATKPAPGTLSADGLQICCITCEEIFPFNKDWDYDTLCPRCEDTMVSFCCEGCQYLTCGEYPEEPVFPNQTCCECGMSISELKEIKEEEEEMDREMESKANVLAWQQKKKRGMGVMRRSIHPSRRPPRTESEALHLISPSIWAQLRPLVVRELKEQGLDVQKTLTMEWCKHHVDVFERCWREEHEQRLELGLIRDLTGKMSYAIMRMRGFFSLAMYVQT